MAIFARGAAWARAALGADPYAATYHAGQTLSMGAALDEIRAALDDPPWPPPVRDGA